MKRLLSRGLLCASMLTFLGGDCSGVSVENGSFRVWQNDGQLGAWDVTAGSIRKAPTWDDADQGVEFLEAPTEIAQTVTATSTCAQVTVMGKVDADAQLSVSTTRSVGIPALNWDSHTFYLDFAGIPIQGESTLQGNTIRIRKTGPGTVILARIDVKGVSGCGPSTAKQ